MFVNLFQFLCLLSTSFIIVTVCVCLWRIVVCSINANLAPGVLLFCCLIAPEKGFQSSSTRSPVSLSFSPSLCLVVVDVLSTHKYLVSPLLVWLQHLAGIRIRSCCFEATP